jgi:hypothetical protein
MYPLPGIGVIRRSYGFVSAEFGTILRLSWFPLLIVAIGQYLVDRSEVDNVIVVVESMNPALLSQTQWLPFFSALLGVVAVSIVAVAIHRTILFGDRRPGTYVYFAFGKVEVLFIVLPLLIFVAAFVLSLPVGVAAAFIDPTNPVVYFAALAIPAAIVVFFSVRLSPLLPLAVVEERFDFRAAWQLTEGNFWRLLGTFFLGWLPFVVVLLGIGFVVGSVAGTSSLTADAKPDEVMAALRRWSELLPVVAAINYVILIVAGAVGVALLSYSYKALKGYGPDDMVPR